MKKSTARLATALTAGAAGVAGLALATGSVPGVEGLGPRLAQAQGHVDRDVHDRPAEVPAADLPDWARAGTSTVTVVREADGADGAGAAVRADLAVPAGFVLPDSCTDVEHVGMPFDGGGDDWPDSRGPGERCGPWSVVVAQGHLYVWR
ncbi:hypothetical protein FHR75_000166 [Kineococcus radiotolerans]|uniref:Secreted protein n=1 Tax=Kineococcus radiotolerans TaxID=131568 RepID=A0A7W4TIA4_KINRA|nr:hypothetical protein [Kineococcus radiotolerans]MBB2899378.1 hypothetical protein [Kineococcus radiotolerans]